MVLFCFKNGIVLFLVLPRSLVKQQASVETLLFRTYRSARPFETAREHWGITDLDWPVLITPSATASVSEMFPPSDFELAPMVGREATRGHSAFSGGKEPILTEHTLCLITLAAF